MAADSSPSRVRRAVRSSAGNRHVGSGMKSCCLSAKKACRLVRFPSSAINAPYSYFDSLSRVVHRRIVVGHDTDGFSLHQQIGDDVQNRLRFSRAGRSLYHAHPIAQRPLHGEFLAGVAAEGIDEGHVVDIARRRPPVQIGIQRRTGILRIDALHRLGEQGGDRTFLLPFGNLLCGFRIGLRLQRGFGCENLREIGK